MAKRKVFEAVINAAQELRKLGGTQAERMARAAEQGYDTSRTLYHGTAYDVPEFRLTKTGEFGPAVYTTDSAKEASQYAFGSNSRSIEQPPYNVMPLHMRLENPFTDGVSAFWKRFNRETDGDKEAIQRAIDAGYDGVIEEKLGSAGKTFKHYIAFEPNQLRSVNADFNPEYRNSPNLLAGIAGAMPYAGATAAALAGATGSQEAEAGPLQALGRAAPYLTSAALGGAAALQSGDAEAGPLDALGRAAPYLATGALGAAMMTPQDAQAGTEWMNGKEPISIMPPTYSDTMQRTQAAINKIDQFKAKRAGKRGAMDIMKLELQTLLKGANEVANDVIFPALDKPMQGYLGIAEVFGALAQGKGFDTAMQRGGAVARQPSDRTLHNMGQETERFVAPISTPQQAEFIGDAAELGLNAATMVFSP